MPRSAEPFAPAPLGPAREIVAASLVAIGGLEAWRSTQQVQAEVVVSITMESVPLRISFQRHQIDLNGGRLKAAGATGLRLWQVVVDDRGQLHWGTYGLPQEASQRQQIADALALLLRRWQGPMALLGGGVRCTSAEHVRVDGTEVVRVALQGSPTGETAYYFDPASGLLRYVTAGLEQPGGGTVTIYEYAKLPGGLVYPARLRVVKTGDYMLLGNQVILEAAYSNVVLH